MFNNIDEFYPTPAHLIRKMFEGIDFRLINNALEPSAGKGDIAEYIKTKMQSAKSNYGYNQDKIKCDIDTVEINSDLQHILRGKGFKVIHDDFLTLNTFKQYSLIAMNPPFSVADRHLTKALEMQQHGGQVVCLLNAETLKNPYSNSRKDLLRKLEEYNAKIEYIQDAFMDAERKTAVEIALIKVEIPYAINDGIVFENLKKKVIPVEKTKEQSASMVYGNYIEGIVQQYNFEIQAGVNIINEYEALKPYMLKSFTEKSCILNLSIYGEDSRYTEKHSTYLINEYIKKIRYKYWTTLFQSDKFAELFTESLRQKFYNKLDELVDYDFSLYNINQITFDVNQNMMKNLDDTILALFEELSYKNSWYDETSKNIHYYNGWKTNKSYIINKKVIIPLSGYGWSGVVDWKVRDKLSDIEKVFNYLDNGTTPDVDMKEVLDTANKEKQYSKIRFKFFTATFYKKGTCHLEFTDADLLLRFNYFGSQKLGWLPPSYGKKMYSQMTQEEKTIIDEFQGEKEYNRVLANREFFLAETGNNLLQLGA